MGAMLAAAVRRRFFTQTGPTGRRWKQTKAAKRARLGGRCCAPARSAQSITHQVSGRVLRSRCCASAPISTTPSDSSSAAGRSETARAARAPARRESVRLGALSSIVRSLTSRRSSIPPPPPGDCCPTVSGLRRRKSAQRRAVRRKGPVGVFIRPRPFLGLSARDRRKAKQIVVERMRAAVK